MREVKAPEVSTKSHLWPILEEVDRLYSSKNKDYGSHELKYKNFTYNSMIWGDEEWKQMMYRASEKMIRIANLAGREASYEGIDDSLRDIITLTTMALDDYRSKHGN